MAYINVAEWSPDQVTDWLKGLDNSMYHYINSFTNNEVRGQQLLDIRPYELEQLGMYSIGHQEIVLEAVEHLRNFHYHLDKENLQFLALHVATASQCLHNQLAQFEDKSKIETQILSDVTRTIATIKPLISWLDRSPFHKINRFVELRNNMLRCAIEIATMAQRDRFVENPVDQIKITALKVAKLANYIIQDVSDVMILQPATLNLVTLKKKESELGFNIVSSYHGIHVVTDIVYNSPAHVSGKIEEGDEIIQINYQTVVGWHNKTVLDQLRESPPDILITLKKRPQDSKIYGPMYMKPYRLPSKKKVMPYRWGSDTQPSPRMDLLPIKDFPMPLSQVPEKHTSSDSDCSDILTPTDTKSSDKDLRLYLPKPRAVLQRRNTICGDQVSGFKNNVMFWHEYKNRTNTADSPSLRDKSVSFGFGLEIAPRPTTCLGIGNAGGKFNDFSGLKGSLPEITDANGKSKKSDRYLSDTVGSKPGISKVVRFDSSKKFNEYKDNKYACNVENTILEVFEPIPYVDEDDLLMATSPAGVPTTECDKSKETYKVNRIIGPDVGLTQAVNQVLVQREIAKWEKCSKSHSLPINNDDSSDNDSDVPPAIEPRIEFLLKTPPAPPPRPRKLIESTTPPPIAQPSITQAHSAPIKLKLPVIEEPRMTSVSDIKKIVYNHQQQQQISDSILECDPNENDFPEDTDTPMKIPATKHFLEERFEELELLTPNKTKNLTLKKKNSIMVKRRNITLKTLEVSDIQGHLYRRSKDKHGVTYWAKLYFVLTDASLYGFKSKDSDKADCLIFLTGFTVSLAAEVHSKPFAFKVYHPAKTFYFAAESQQALNQWIDYIKQATIKRNTNTIVSQTRHVVNIKDLFSETESSGDESDISQQKQLGTPSPIQSVTGRFGQKRTNVQTSVSDESTHVTQKTEKYHLGFGSLKKFTKQNLPFTSNKTVKKVSVSSDVPVPTAQFRSYRKVPGNAGLQLGTNSMISATGDAEFVPPLLSSIDSSFTHKTTETTTIRKASITSLSQVANQPVAASFAISDAPPTFKFQRDIKVKTKKLRKTSPYNYIHASNPNLVEFDFPTSKTLDYSFPKVNASNSWDAHHNLQGFVTLKDLMLQKQEEDAKEMYNNRVNLGVEKKNDSKTKRRHRRITGPTSELHPLSNKPNDEDGSTEKPHVVKIQSRSLPKTPDYAQSFKPDDSDIIMTRSREGQKLRDFGYEFISGDDPPNEKLSTKNTVTSAAASPSVSTTTKKKSGLNWIGNSDRRNDDDKSSRSGSFKKSKNKLVSETLESFKTSSEKLFQFRYASSSSSSSTNNKDSLQLNQKSGIQDKSLKPVTSYLPLTLNKKLSGPQMYNIQSDDNIMVHLPVSGGIKKSSTYNTAIDFKDAINRKNSAPERSPAVGGNNNSSVFTKLSFTSSKPAKEKKLLGSPRLHRALFGRRESETQSFDHEIFSPIDFKPRPSVVVTSSSMTTSISTTSSISDHPLGSGVSSHQPATTHKISHSNSSHTVGSPDYHLEYPPVFEPETYSLSDPNTSLTLMRRRNHLQMEDKEE